MMETLDRRVLGAVRFRDAVTGFTVAGPLVVDAPGVRWIRNRRGWWVIAAAPGLEAHTLAFEQPPTTPALGSVPVVLTVADATGRYLPRRAALALPRTSAQGRVDEPESLFQPVEVDLFPSPAAPVAAGWATVRASVENDDGPMAGALVRAVRKGAPNEVLGTGLADARGEALVAVPGIPVTTWQEGQGGVLATELDAVLQVFWAKDQPRPPDPDAMVKGKKAVKTADVKLASGRELTVRL